MPSGKATDLTCMAHGMHAVHRPYPDAQLKQRWHLGAAATHAATALADCHLQALLMLAELLVQPMHLTETVQDISEDEKGTHTQEEGRGGALHHEGEEGHGAHVEEGQHPEALVPNGIVQQHEQRQGQAHGSPQARPAVPGVCQHASLVSIYPNPGLAPLLRTQAGVQTALTASLMCASAHLCQHQGCSACRIAGTFLACHLAASSDLPG